jgi:hypothetical protein
MIVSITSQVDLKIMIHKVRQNLFWILTPSILLQAGIVQAANIVVDNFNLPSLTDTPPSQLVQANPGQTPFSEMPDLPLGSPGYPSSQVLGGYRDLFLTNVTGNMPTQSARGVVGAGILNYANDAAIGSELRITWDGQDKSSAVNTSGLGGINLSQNGVLDALAANFTFADKDLSAMFTIWDMAGNQSSATYTFPSGISSSQPVYFAYTQEEFDKIIGSNKALFSSGVDFTNVGAIQLSLKSASNQVALDATVDGIESADVVGELPEPTSILALVGAAVLGAISRKQKDD